MGVRVAAGHSGQQRWSRRWRSCSRWPRHVRRRRR